MYMQDNPLAELLGDSDGDDDECPISRAGGGEDDRHVILIDITVILTHTILLMVIIEVIT